MDEIVRGMCVVHGGQILWGVKELPVPEIKKPEEQKPTGQIQSIGITVDKHVKFI